MYELCGRSFSWQKSLVGKVHIQSCNTECTRVSNYFCHFIINMCHQKSNFKGIYEWKWKAYILTISSSSYESGHTERIKWVTTAFLPWKLKRKFAKATQGCNWRGCRKVSARVWLLRLVQLVQATSLVLESGSDILVKKGDWLWTDGRPGIKDPSFTLGFSAHSHQEGNNYRKLKHHFLKSTCRIQPHS